MDSHSKDVERASGGIEAGIRDVLVVAGQPIYFSQVGTVEHIEGLFRCGRDGAVADKSIYASHSQVFSVYIRNPSEVASNARDVSWARPGGTVRHNAYDRRAIC